MRPVLLIDFGSTFTKLTAVDVQNAVVLGRAQAFTTVEEDIGIGFEQALSQLESSCGKLPYDARLACSSAAGGLNMVACGLVPSLTSKAARLASFGAGAKVIRNYAYELTRDDLKEIEDIKPDILLLTGGIDGGNSEVVIANAHALSKVEGNFPIVIACNRVAQEECQKALEDSDHPVYRAPNVMPEMDKLCIEPVQQVIREVFLQRIVHAKGLSKTSQILDGILMPTPSAVMEALTLLAKGTSRTRGIGELMALDLGGATTDVYSIAKGDPTIGGVVLRGLPEPFAKRTVEGDIGMRYNALGVLQAVGVEGLADLCGLPDTVVQQKVQELREQPSRLPGDAQEEQIDFGLAAGALRVAMVRHAGSLRRVYTPIGPIDEQTGKDLTQVARIIVTGGALVFAKQLSGIIKAALDENDPFVLIPKNPKVLSDRQYVLSALGLLSGYDRDAALAMLLEIFGKDEDYAVV